MKNQILRLLALLVIVFISSNYAKAAESKIYIDGELHLKIDHIGLDQNIKVIAQSSKGEFVSGKLGTSESPRKKGDAVTLEHKISKSDLKLGYVTVEIYFMNANGKVEDSFIKVIPILSKKELARRAKETDEERMKRVLKELGFDKQKCDSMFEN